jgi:hypothetical protein
MATKAKITKKGLRAENPDADEWQHVFADKGFAISGEDCRKDKFPGTILYYFEVTKKSSSG